MSLANLSLRALRLRLEVYTMSRHKAHEATGRLFEKRTKGPAFLQLRNWDKTFLF
jgi:hypothetical protein